MSLFSSPDRKHPKNSSCLSIPELGDNDFRFIRNLVRARFGINLTRQKRFLVIGRLRQLLIEKNIPSFSAYRSYLENNPGQEAMDELINRITTNHTYFFREPEHFKFMSGTILPELEARYRNTSGKDLRIWCSASSSGEEPYSIIITMMEFFGAQYSLWDAGVLATDISARALDTARKGVYSADQLKKIPQHLVQKYFLPLKNTNYLAIRESVSREVTFRRFNLMNAKFPFRKPFDVIFCRNVMIYFNRQTRENLIKQMVRFLVPGGYLLIGHSEGIDRSTPDLDYIKPAVYRKKTS